MFRTNHPITPSKENINLLIQNAGLGDNIAALVPVKYILDNYPHINLLIYVPDYLKDFTVHVLPKRAIVRDYSEGKKKYNEKLTALSNEWVRITAMKMHPVDHAFIMFLDKIPTIEHKNYPKIRPNEIDITKFSLPDKYVCINVGATCAPKELSPVIINTISTYILSMGFMPVFLGKKESPTGYGDKTLVANILDIDFTKGIDLTNKTSLLECTAIISKAKCLIGMEGGLTHLAACTDTHIISSYTFVDPSIMAPIRNNEIGHNMNIITPPSSLSCRFCQSNMSFTYHDFRNCFYSDLLCTKLLKADNFIEAFEKIL